MKALACGLVEALAVALDITDTMAAQRPGGRVGAQGLQGSPGRAAGTAAGARAREAERAAGGGGGGEAGAKARRWWGLAVSGGGDVKLRGLAKRLECELQGDGEVDIVRAAPIESAAAGAITFVANPRYRRYLATTKASAVITGPEAPPMRTPSLRTAHPQYAFARAIELLHPPPRPAPGIHPSAVITPSAVIGARAFIGPCAVVGEGVRIGADARIEAHVVIYDHVVIGDRFTAHAHVTVREGIRIGDDVTLHSGAGVGADGFGYAPGPDGRMPKVTQAVGVVLKVPNRVVVVDEEVSDVADSAVDLVVCRCFR